MHGAYSDLRVFPVGVHSASGRAGHGQATGRPTLESGILRRLVVPCTACLPHTLPPNLDTPCTVSRPAPSSKRAACPEIVIARPTFFLSTTNNQLHVTSFTQLPRPKKGKEDPICHNRAVSAGPPSLQKRAIVGADHTLHPHTFNLTNHPTPRASPPKQNRNNDDGRQQ